MSATTEKRPSSPDDDEKPAAKKVKKESGSFLPFCLIVFRSDGRVNYYWNEYGIVNESSQKVLDHFHSHDKQARKRFLDLFLCMILDFEPADAKCEEHLKSIDYWNDGIKIEDLRLINKSRCHWEIITDKGFAKHTDFGNLPIRIITISE
jgi:hypothetical protein